MNLKMPRTEQALYLILFFLLSTGMTYAQSSTYQIEKLSKPEKLLPTVPPGKLFGQIDKNFLKLSVTDELVELGTRPVITGYLRAYQNHYPVTISPDIAWLLICQGFSHHLNSNSEALRSLLVDFKDKKELAVIRNMTGTGDLSVFPWESVFPEFVQQISAYTGPKLIENLSADFTTTTPTSLIAGQITIMESMKEFFNYKVILVGCGIPEVTIEGSAEDWEKISRHLDYLSQYDLKWWTSELKPVIQKIIDTKRGKFDKAFWMNMIKYHKSGLYGSYDGIDGWLLKFYPYLEGHVKPAVQAATGSPDAGKDITRSAPALFPSDNMITLNKVNGTKKLTRSDFKEIKSVSVVPKEMANVPFVFEIQDNTGKVLTAYKMEFWAGFMGVKQNKSTFNIKPEIGWAVNLPEEKK